VNFTVPAGRRLKISRRWYKISRRWYNANQSVGLTLRPASVYRWFLGKKLGPRRRGVAGAIFLGCIIISVAPAGCLEPEPLAKFGDLGIPNPPFGQNAKSSAVPGNQMPGNEFYLMTALQPVSCIMVPSYGPGPKLGPFFFNENAPPWRAAGHRFA
jgi:hypothetical protein